MICDVKNSFLSLTNNKHSTCSYALTLNPLQQAIEAVHLPWAFRENCLSVFYEFFRGMVDMLTQWVPLCLLQGRSCYGGTLLVTFLLLLTEK